MSDAPMILCDCAISLISICGSDQCMHDLVLTHSYHDSAYCLYSRYSQSIHTHSGLILSKIDR